MAVAEELLRLVVGFAKEGSGCVVVKHIAHDASGDGDVVRQSVIGAERAEGSVILDDVETIDGALQHDGGFVRPEEELVVRAEERETAVRSGDGNGLLTADGDAGEIGMPDILGLGPLDEVGVSRDELVCLLEGDGLTTSLIPSKLSAYWA